MSPLSTWQKAHRAAALALSVLFVLAATPDNQVDAAQRTGLGRAVPAQEGLSAARLTQVDAFAHDLVDRGQSPGVVILIARHGKLVHVDAYGPADESSGRPIRPQDIFRLHSMTKPITSVALLMLYEQGKFQLDEPLARYLPAFRDVRVYAGASADGQMLLEPPRRPITIQDVLRHTAGFAYVFRDGAPVEKAYRAADLFSQDLQHFIQELPKLPLLYQPGERWFYSVASDVQAVLVEQLSGMKFDEFVRRNIFTPLRMHAATFALPPAGSGRVPVLYARGPGGKLVPAHGPLPTVAEEYGKVPYGGHSISCSAYDFLRFAQMLLNGGQLDGVRVLRAATVRLMTSNQLPDAVLARAASGELAPGTGFGYGVSVLIDPTAPGAIGSASKFAWSGAASTHFFVDPKQDLIGLYFTQLMAGDPAWRGRFETLVYQATIGP